MKKILKYTKGKQNTYKVHFEDEEVILYDDIVIKYELLLKKKISEEELITIKKENNSLGSYYKALTYITKKMRSIKEVKDYLKKAEYQEEDIAKTIAKLQKENILNDDHYTEIFINDALRLSLDGPEKIKRKLNSLGIDEETIKKHLDQVEYNIWLEKINKIIEKRQKGSHNESSSSLKQKITNYLITNGYSMYLIKEQIENIKLENNPNAIEKEKEKQLRKLSRKYSGEQLTFQLKQKLYQKGFTKEEIEETLKK